METESYLERARSLQRDLQSCECSYRNLWLAYLRAFIGALEAGETEGARIIHDRMPEELADRLGPPPNQGRSEGPAGGP